jgi:hypothetical protein
MKREQNGDGIERDAESEHEKHSRIRNEQERLLRKQLCHLRPAEVDEVDLPQIPRYKDAGR